jgi:isopentenyl-diphosphate delta-isomerase
LREELGIAGLALAWRDRLEYRADVGGGMTEHEVVDIFVAEAPATLRQSPAPSEVMATRWIDVDELAVEVAAAPERFTPWLRIYLDRSRDRIFGISAA